MALMDNPIVKAMMEKNKMPAPPQGQPAATASPQSGLPQLSVSPQSHIPAPAPVANGAETSTHPVAQRPPTSAYAARSGEPNRGMDPIDSRRDNQQTYPPYSPSGYNPMPLYDNGGEVKVSDNPGVLNRLGNKAKGVISAIKSIPPNRGEAESLAEKNAQVEALAAQREPAERKEGMRQIMPSDHVNEPSTEYGARPGSGQVLYHVDADGNLTPIRVAPPAPAQEERPAMRQMAPVQAEPRMKPIIPESLKTPLPTYDKGGDVSAAAARQAQAEGDARINSLLSSSSPSMKAPAQEEMGDNPFGLKTIGDAVEKRREGRIKQPSYMPKIGGAEAEQAPAMPMMGLKSAPIADSGGDVPIDVNDGKHQVAILQDGEKVLTPEQADKYRAEHPEESGAPADFQGRVLANPKGVKPSNSEEDNRASDTDRLSGGAKTSVDNAPLETPKGDISNPPAADVQPDQSREISNKTTLRPYSQVVEERAKQKAKEQVQSPGVQPITSEGSSMKVEEKPVEEQKVEEKPKLTLGHLLAQDWLSKLSKPAQMNAPDAQAGGPPAPAQPGMKPIAPPTGPAGPAPTGKEAFKQHIAKYDADYQAAMDKAAQTNDPQYREQAARIKEAKLAYQDGHPWGSPESAHPGVLGKLGHIGERVAARTPFAGISQITATVPGSEAYRAGEKEKAEAETKEATAENAKENKDKAEQDNWKPVGGAVGPNGRVMLMNSKTNEVKEAPEGFTPYDKPEHLGDQAKYIEQWYKDHPDAPKSTANDDKAIQQLGEAKAAAAQENKAKGKIYYYDTPNGRQGYTYTEAQAAGLKPEDGYSVSSQQADKDRKADDTYNSLKTVMTQYKDNIDKSIGQLLPSDVENMSSMIESVEAPDYVSKIVSGVVDDFYGKPVTGYNEKLMKGALTKKAYDAMSPAARQLVADYFTTLMAHFGNVKATLGQVPRNEKLITTEMNMIPKPYLTSEEAAPAFSNYTAQVERNNAHNVKFGNKVEGKASAPTNEHQKFIQSITLPDGSHPKDAARGPNGSTIVWSGKAGDPWVDLATGNPVK